MPFFKVNLEWDGTLEDDVSAQKKGIEAAANAGLRSVESQMYADLQRHIREDWYRPWGPPKMYERRTDNEALGTPLGDPSNMDSSVSGLSLEFVYSPSGDHEYPAWSNSASGDKLISILQTNDGWRWKPSTDKKGREIMPRPFWNNFVREQFGGAAFDSFEYGFAGRGFDLIREGGEKDLLHSGGESEPEAGVSEVADLPY